MEPMETDKRTTIELKMGTKDKLEELGTKKDSYDKLVNKLIDFYLENNGDSI